MKRWLILVSLAVAAPAAGAPWVPRERLVEIVHPAAELPAFLDTVSRSTVYDDAAAQLARWAAFEQKMQFTTPCGSDGGDDGGAAPCDLGGVIEVESGNGNAIVQSDNTQEAISSWSFLRRRTGDAGHQAATTLAFEYLGRNPGWLEWQDGNGSGPDYYSLYNCGWGMRAVIEYEAATGDMSHHDYGLMCAQHVRDDGLTIAKSSSSLIEQGTAAWGGSGLWLWGDANGSAADRQAAAEIGGQVKTWLDGGGGRPASTTWAMSGGAVFYGVVGSYMKEHPDELAAWLDTTAPRLGGWIDESKAVGRPPGEEWTDWRNAWNAWNMLAQFTAAKSLTGADADAHRQIAMDIYLKLGAQDNEMDGGIPGSQQRPETEDQSWISSYFGWFGVREVLALEPPPAPDAGATDAEADGGGPPHEGGGCSCAVGARGGDGGASGALLLGGLIATLFAARSLFPGTRRRTARTLGRHRRAG